MSRNPKETSENTQSSTKSGVFHRPEFDTHNPKGESLKQVRPADFDVEEVNSITGAISREVVAEMLQDEEAERDDDHVTRSGH